MRTTLAFVVLALASLSLPLHAQNPTLQTAMRAKLVNAQELLELLVRGNFVEIDRRAELLSRITDVEIASWQAVARPDNTEMASLFLLSVDGLRSVAADRNLEDTLIDYTTMVSACTRCHTYVRDARPRPTRLRTRA